MFSFLYNLVLNLVIIAVVFAAGNHAAFKYSFDFVKYIRETVVPKIKTAYTNLVNKYAPSAPPLATKWNPEREMQGRDKVEDETS